MITCEPQSLLDQILHAIEHEDMVLPTLPEAASDIQSLISDPNGGADRIVDVISGDPFISAQLIKAANSAQFADKPPAGNVRLAMSRLGYRQLHALVMDVTGNKMVFANNPILNARMSAVLERSREVATLSYVLASRYPYLSPDRALLAGLLHDIGILPLCLHIEKNYVQITEEMLDELIGKCHSIIGAALLKKWNFPSEVIEAVAEHENLNRDAGVMRRADYADVVCVASLQSHAESNIVAWDKIAAVKRLGLNAEDCRMFHDRHAGYIAVIEERLGIRPQGMLATASIRPDKAHMSKHAQNAMLPPKKGALSSFLSLWG